jgi:hypothetical protein
MTKPTRTKTEIHWYENKPGDKKFSVHLHQGALSFSYSYCKTDHGWFWCAMFNSRWQVCVSCLSHFLDEKNHYVRYGFALDEVQAKECVREYIAQITRKGKLNHHHPSAVAHAHPDWARTLFQRSRLADLVEGRPILPGFYDEKEVLLDRVEQLQAAGMLELVRAGLLMPTGQCRRDGHGKVELVFTLDPGLSEKQVEKRLADIRKRSA